MQSAKRREDEAESLKALRSLQVLDSEPEPDFDALVRAASLACGVPIALISLVDADRQWFKANIGLPGVTETPREVSFCAHAILGDGLFVVPDAVLDPRFADNPHVTGDPNIRFYAGAPICLSDGHRIGTLCVVDRKPRELDATQREILQCLAMAAARVLEGRRASYELMAQRQRLANIIDGTDVGTWEWNVTTGELRINERFARIVGCVIDDSRATTIETWVAHVHPDDLIRSDALLKQHFKGLTERYECEVRLRHVDGHWVWVQDRGRVITRGVNGEPQRMFGTRWDISERKSQQVALHKSEAFLGRTGRVAGVGGWELDLITSELTWSDETRRIHGVEPGCQPALAEAIHFYAEEARPVIQAAIQRAMSTGEGWDLELPVIRRDGRRIWARAAGGAENEAGKPVRLVGAFQDITQRKELELQLAAASARVLDLYDNAPCGYHSLDDQGRFLHINATAAAWLGCTCEELIGKRQLLEFFTPEGQEQFRRYFGKLITEGRVDGLEFDLLPMSGVARRVSLTATAVMDAAGRYAMSRTVMFDITDLHRTREALCLLTAEQSAMLDNEVIGIVRLRDRRATWSNRALGRIFGYERDELLGQPSRMLYLDDESCRAIGDVAYPVLSRGKTYRTQLQMRRKDGSSVWIDLSGTLMPTHPHEAMWLMVDITPLKQAEALRLKSMQLEAENRQLLESSRLKSQFLDNMSHELRTPLNAVIGFSQLLQCGVVKQESPDYMSSVDQIGASGRHLLQLIETMLDYSKAESDKIDFHPEPLDLAQVIQEVIDMLQAQCESGGVVITVSVAEDVRAVQADPLRLRQVLSNLVGNAVKFSNQGGQVEIRVRQEGTAQFCVEVEDHGIGIATANLPQLFTNFHQLSVGDGKTHEGTGLGLALVRRLVESQGGTVGVRSALGVGSVFYITMPCRGRALPVGV